MIKWLPLIGLILFSASSLAQSSQNVDLLFHWEDTTIVPSSAHNNTYNEIWGYERDGREYAIIGTTDGTHIFDVTDPVNSIQVQFVAGQVQGSGIVHRDFHDYRDHLYIVADEPFLLGSQGYSTLQIVDLRQLPDTAIVVYNSDTLFQRAHNIFIDQQAGKLYQCGGDGANHLSVYDLVNNLAVPELIIDCREEIEWWGTTVNYLHDIFVRNDTAWCNAGTYGLFVVDFSNTTEPVLIGSLTNYTQQGYNHSGWLNEAGDTYALADETHGMDIKILDVSDLDNIEVLDTIDSGVNDTLSVPHNLIFHDDFLYVAYYKDGMYIYDCSDLNNIHVAGYYDTSTEPHAANWRGNWGVYPFLSSGIVLASDMQEGLFVFDVTNAISSVPTITPITHFIKPFPNPFTSEINIDLPMQFGEQFSYRLTDVQGKLIAAGSLPSGRTTLSTTFLSAGTYVLSINAGRVMIQQSKIFNVNK